MNSSLTVDRELARVSLAEIDRGWLGKRRFDSKFLIADSQLSEFINRFSDEFAILEIAGKSKFQYRTQYFDTPALDCYRDHLQRKSRRAKIRIRSYLDSNLSRLEVKVRFGNLQSIKFSNEGSKQLGETEAEFVESILQQQLPNSRLIEESTNLQPMALNTFERSTLSHANQQERVTIDSLLAVSAFGREFQIRPGHILLEVKSLKRSSVVVQALLKSGIRPMSFSKYCASIDLTTEDRPRVHRPSFLERNFFESSL